MNILAGPPWNPTITGDFVIKKSIFSTNSVLPACQNSRGNHIGYSEVVERLGDGSYTIHKFSNFDNGYLDEKYCNSLLSYSMSPYLPYNSKSQERGNLLSKTTHDNSGNLKYKEINNYSKLGTTFVKSIAATSISVCPGLAIGYYEGTSTKIYTYSMLLSKKK